MNATTWVPHDAGFEKAVRAGIERSPVIAFFGLRIEEISAGSVVLTLDHRPELGHAPGYFQAGIMMAIADYAGCYSNYTLEPAGCTHTMLDQTTKFLGSAQGTRLIARGRVVTSGRTIMVGACDVYVLRAGAEYLVATALMTTHHRAPPGSIALPTL